MAVVSGGVLTFVIVGRQDQPIYEVDLTGPKEVRCCKSSTDLSISVCHAAFSLLNGLAVTLMQQQTQYLHQFVLHASLDAVDEAMWTSKELHLKVCMQHQDPLTCSCCLVTYMVGH